MGIFGSAKKEVVKPVVREEVDIDNVIKGIESKGANVSGEVGGFGNYQLVKPIDLTSDLDISAGKNEIERGNLVVFNAKSIVSNRPLFGTLVERLKAAIEESHGDVAMISNEKLLAVPPGFKIVGRG